MKYFEILRSFVVLAHVEIDSLRQSVSVFQISFNSFSPFFVSSPYYFGLS